MHPSRRAFTRIAIGLAGTVVVLGGCGTIDASQESGDTAKGTGDTGGGTTVDPGTWATGGTASMSGDYADPFTDVGSCALICEMTEGPCTGDAPDRQDISEGVDGLPVRLALRIVDTTCTAVSGAVVEVWHAAPSGLYSGAEASEMCTDGDAEAVASHWFRGTRTTDSAGRVDFDTCFPGWYSGRAVHIHFRVWRDDQSYAVAQLFFDQTLIDTIYTEHVAYLSRGTPDTPNSTDKVLGDNDIAPYLLDTAQQADGALLAWKTITVRASLSEDTCTAPESGGGGP